MLSIFFFLLGVQPLVHKFDVVSLELSKKYAGLFFLFLVIKYFKTNVIAVCMFKTNTATLPPRLTLMFCLS